MKDLTIEDFKYAKEIIDDVVDNDVDFSKILETINHLYQGRFRKQFLNHVSTLFGNVMLNEVNDREDGAYERAHQARMSIVEQSKNNGQ